VGAYGLTGEAGSLLKSYELGAATGGYAVDGVAAVLSVDEGLVSGVYSVTGASAGLEAGRELPAAEGAYAVTGEAAALTVGGQVSKTGFSVAGGSGGGRPVTDILRDLDRRRTLAAEAGVFRLSGDINLVVGRKDWVKYDNDFLIAA
jgi:hypothetical protein